MYYAYLCITLKIMKIYLMIDAAANVMASSA